MKHLLTLLTIILFLEAPVNASERFIYDSDLLIPIGVVLSVASIWSMFEYRNNRTTIYIPITGFSFGVAGVTCLTLGFFYHNK